jgi:hypothetical protein
VLSHPTGLPHLSQFSGHSPEPASLTLLGIGSLVLFGYGWRRRKHAAA